MANKFQSVEKFRRPELFLSELLKRSAQGLVKDSEEQTTFLHRAVVVAVDVIGGKLENPFGNGFVNHVIDGKSVDVPATVGPLNPPDSVKARIIANGLDQFVGDRELRVFWPLFPEHMSSPIKPGEHVYVVFEDSDMQHGLWFCRVPGQDGANFFRGQDSFKNDSSTPLSGFFPDSSGGDRSSEETFDTDRSASESLINEGRLSALLG